MQSLLVILPVTLQHYESVDSHLEGLNYHDFRAAASTRLISRELFWLAFLRTAHTLVIDSKALRTVIRPFAPYVLCVLDNPEASLDISNQNVVMGGVDAIRGLRRWRPTPFRLLDDGNLIHLFVSDWMDADHPKLTVLPIGFEGRGIHARVKPGSLSYEQLLKQIPRNFLPNKERPLQVLSTAHFSTYARRKLASNSSLGHSRLAMISALRSKPFIHFPSRRLSFVDTLRLHANYSFALCPEGNGMDTHRFYETLAAGVIPIVQRHTLSGLLYERHFKAVLVIDKWEEVTMELIAHQRQRLAPLLSDAPLHMGYWLDAIDAVFQRHRLPSTFDQ